MKNVWITALEKDENTAKELFQTITRYGLNAGGHFWTDDLEKMEWAGAISELSKKETALWIITGKAESLAAENVRYGLSLLAVAVHAQKGHGFPIFLVLTEGEIEPETLPTPLKGIDVLSASSSGFGAKVTAQANMPVKKVELEYRLDIHALPGIGQWFEIGPARGHTWQGAMFGVDAGEINFHGVGPSGRLPDKATLNYPMQGLKLKVGDTDYTAWAVKNDLNERSSYFVRVKDYPGSILLGSFSEDDDAEAYVVTLK